MATRRRYQQETLSQKAVTAYAHFQFSGSGGVSNFSGSGFSGCYLSGTTYTLVGDSAWPQLVNLSAQLAVSPSYIGTPSGSLDVVFNGSQLNQFTQHYTGSVAAATGSSQAQTIDFNVIQGTNALPVAVPYQSGTNWAYIKATFLNQNYSKG